MYHMIVFDLCWRTGSRIITHFLMPSCYFVAIRWWRMSTCCFLCVSMHFTRQWIHSVYYISLSLVSSGQFFPPQIILIHLDNCLKKQITYCSVMGNILRLGSVQKNPWGTFCPILQKSWFPSVALRLYLHPSPPHDQEVENQNMEYMV